MKKLENVRLEPLKQPKFVKTSLMRFTLDGVERSWELADVHDSVAILLYHKAHHSFVLVKQFRPPVYLKNHHGYTYEMCAGICDKDISKAKIAQEEILEECGFDVPLQSIERVTSFYSSVGFAGSQQELFYAELDESMRVHQGGGIDEEDIEVVEIAVDQAHRFMFDESMAKTTGVVLAMMWWFDRKRFSREESPVPEQEN